MIAPFNILAEDHGIHGMPAIGFNCGTERSGYRAWATRKGMPIAATHCGRELQSSGWLWPLFDEDISGLVVNGWVSTAGFWYPQGFRVERFENFYADAVPANQIPVSASTILGHQFAIETNPENGLLNDVGSIRQTDWLNPTTLVRLDPQSSYSTNPCVRFKPMFGPFCERMGIIQNVWFDDDGPHATPETNFVWLAPRSEINRENKDFLLDNASRRPWKPSLLGLPGLESKTYADWTWTPKRNWHGSGNGYHGPNDETHIWGDPDVVHVPFLYELPATFWDIVADGEPDMWDFDQWAQMLVKATYGGGGLGNWSDRWEGEDFGPAWDTAFDFAKDVPKKTVIDVRVEVLTYQWRFYQKSHYYVAESSAWATTPWICISNHNYLSSRVWTTLRQVAPVHSKESLGV